MYQIIDGKKISQEIKDEMREKAAALKEQGTERCLAVIQVGADPASSVYVRNKKKACEYVGIRSLSYELPEETREEELLGIIGELNGREYWYSCLFRHISMRTGCCYPSRRRKTWTASIL